MNLLIRTSGTVYVSMWVRMSWGAVKVEIDRATLRRAGGRARGRLRVVAALMGLTLVGAALGAVPPQALAGASHSEVVATDPVDEVAQLVPTSRFPQPRVDALARRGNTIYVGGAFNQLVDSNGVHRARYLAAIDATTGQVTPFRVRLDGPVLALAVRRGALYIGGTFKSVRGHARHALAKVDARTGKVDRRFDAKLASGDVKDLDFARGRLIAGGSFPGYLRSLSRTTGRPTKYLSLRIRGKVHPAATPTTVFRFDVSPSERRLVAVGNFARVQRQGRERAFMVNLRARRTSLSRWYYPPLTQDCGGRVPARRLALSDVDFAPDGTYFVVGATGGAVPRNRPDLIGTAICDAAARFETRVLHPTKPTWINYTGGDTIWSVLTTGAAVYVQGHFRWLDNPLGRDSAGPGAVSRRGIGAIDPQTGAALEWNPDKPARRGGRALLADSRGLWIGSDSEMLAREPHLGLGLLPLPTAP
jgi:hypothetical protein